MDPGQHRSLVSQNWDDLRPKCMFSYCMCSLEKHVSAYRQDGTRIRGAGCTQSGPAPCNITCLCLRWQAGSCGVVSFSGRLKLPCWSWRRSSTCWRYSLWFYHWSISDHWSVRAHWLCLSVSLRRDRRWLTWSRAITSSQWSCCSTRWCTCEHGVRLQRALRTSWTLPFWSDMKTARCWMTC